MTRFPSLTRACFLRTAGAVALSAALPVRLALPAFAAAGGLLATKKILKSKTGEQLPVIGLGTRAMSRSDSKAAGGQSEVIATLLAGGGRVIDTAANYTGGDSEDFIGEALAKTNARSKVFISTKFAERGKENGLRSIETSFKQLRTDTIDLMYIHNMVDVPTQLPTLEDFKARGQGIPGDQSRQVGGFPRV